MYLVVYVLYLEIEDFLGGQVARRITLYLCLMLLTSLVADRGRVVFHSAGKGPFKHLTNAFACFVWAWQLLSFYDVVKKKNFFIFFELGVVWNDSFWQKYQLKVQQ